MSNSTVSTNYPPDGTNWITSIAPAVNFLMIGATAGSVEVVMLCALLFFSTSTLRRTPIFILNVIAVLMAIAASILNIYEEIHSLEQPTIPVSTAVVSVMGFLSSFGPTFIDCVLLIRLHAVYSARKVERWQMCIILGIPIVLNLGRLANLIYFLTYTSINFAKLNTGGTGAGDGSVIVKTHLPNVKIEWFMQVFDDCYSSTLFLYPLYKAGVLSSSYGVASASRAIVRLFWISVTTFVFPVLLSVAQLVVYLVAPEQYYVTLCIEEVNFHLTVICVVFATIWAFEGRWAADHGIVTDSEASAVSTLRFRPRNQERTDLVEPGRDAVHELAFVSIQDSSGSVSAKANEFSSRSISSA